MSKANQSRWKQKPCYARKYHVVPKDYSRTTCKQAHRFQNICAQCPRYLYYLGECNSTRMRSQREREIR